jgi:hypothetical protein
MREHPIGTHFRSKNGFDLARSSGYVLLCKPGLVTKESIPFYPLKSKEKMTKELKLKAIEDLLVK